MTTYADKFTSPETSYTDKYGSSSAAFSDKLSIQSPVYPAGRATGLLCSPTYPTQDIIDQYSNKY